jgi:hypothetical protein
MKKDVQGLQPDRLDREEVTGQHAVSLGAQELRPGRTAPSRSRGNAMCSKDPPDGGGPDLDPSLLKLTLDPHVTPARILPGQANNQCNDFRMDWWPSRLSLLPICPSPLDQLPMPAEQGLRSDQEADATPPRQNAATRCEQDAIRLPEIGP